MGRPHAVPRLRFTMLPTGPSIGIEYPRGLTVRHQEEAVRIRGEDAAIVHGRRVLLDVIEAIALVCQTETVAPASGLPWISVTRP